MHDIYDFISELQKGDSICCFFSNDKHDLSLFVHDLSPLLINKEENYIFITSLNKIKYLCIKWSMSLLYFYCLFVCLMVLNTTFNNI